MSGRTAFVYVQHLLGIGHYVRSRQVAAALAKTGCDVHFVTGGMPVDGPPVAGLRTVQLPPIHVFDATFSPLRDASGAPIDEAFRRRRRDALADAYEHADPDVVVVETFPFGRRALAFELVPLMERIHASPARPRVVVSIRDILQRHRKPGRDDEVLEAAARWVDAVLVHGDRRFMSLDATFPRAFELAPHVHYTGFVCEARSAPPDARRDEVVVSAGGGAVGAQLVATALSARERSALRDLTWRVLAGANLEVDVTASAGVVVQRGRNDLATALARARVSVSQAGYNTVLEVAAAGARSVLVPFAAGGETEQRMRAQRLAALGLAVVVDEEPLTADTLAAAIDDAASRPRWGRFDFDCDGARRSAELIGRMLDDACRTRATAA